MHKIRGISDHGSIDSHALMTLTPSCWTLWLMKTAWKPLNPNITSACHFFRFHSSIYQFHTFQVYFDSKAQNNGFSWKLNKKECAINFYGNMSFEWFIEIYFNQINKKWIVFSYFYSGILLSDQNLRFNRIFPFTLFAMLKHCGTWFTSTANWISNKFHKSGIISNNRVLSIYVMSAYLEKCAYMDNVY